MIKETMETKEMMKNETMTETAVEKKPVTKKAEKTPTVKKEKKDKPLRTTNKWKVRKEVADALTKKYGFGPSCAAVDIVTVSDQIVTVLVNEIPYSVIRESGEVSSI